MVCEKIAIVQPDVNPTSRFCCLDERRFRFLDIPILADGLAQNNWKNP